MTVPLVSDPPAAHITIDAGVATITMDTPDNRNALSARMRSSLAAHLNQALQDTSVRVVVLTHTGSVFCAGADLTEAASGNVDAASSELADLLWALMASPKPVVAKVTGAARAGGIGLIAACDFAVGVQSATFGFSEVRLGVVPSIISVPLLARICAATLHRLFLTGDVFDAAQAADIGLLSSSCAAENVEERVAELVSSLQLGSPEALAAAKRLTSPLTSTLREDFEVARQISKHHFASADAKEGIAAFREKRPAAWIPAPAPTTASDQQQRPREGTR